MRTPNQTPETLRADNHDLIDRVGDQRQVALNAVLKAYHTGGYGAEDVDPEPLIAGALAEVQRRRRAAAERYAEALAPPSSRAEWEAIANEAIADVAAGRTCSEAELRDYLGLVATGAANPSATETVTPSRATTATTMDGILYLTDEHHRRRFVQIDLDRYDREYIEDFLDGLVAESRKDEESVSLEEALEELRAEGKLDDDDQAPNGEEPADAPAR